MGLGVGMGMGMGMGMDWQSGSRSQSHSRSRPSQLHLHTTGMQGFEFDDPANNNNSNGSTSTNGNSDDVEGGVAIPQSVRTSQGAGATGSGGSGRSLLTKSLQMFGESPPVVGYGGWTGIGRPPAPPPPQAQVQTQTQQPPQSQLRQIGEVVQPQPGMSSEEQQHLKIEQQEAQDETDFGGFLASSLPAYHHLGFSFAQPPSATTSTATTTIASPYAKHVRSTSYDHSFAMDDQANQRPHPPKVPESTLVCHLIVFSTESSTKYPLPG